MNWKYVFVFTLNLTIFISGLIISIAMALAKGNFDGQCPLYLDINWKDITNFVTESWGSESTCNFIIYLQVIVCILIPFVMMVLLGYLIFQSFLGNDAADKLYAPLIFLPIWIISFGLLFVGACIVSVGRSKMCSSLIDYPNSSTKSVSKLTCYDAQNYDWKNKSGKFGDGKFVANIVLCEVVSWINLIWWMCLILLETVAFFKGRAAARASK